MASAKGHLTRYRLPRQIVLGRRNKVGVTYLGNGCRSKTRIHSIDRRRRPARCEEAPARLYTSLPAPERESSWHVYCLLARLSKRWHAWSFVVLVLACLTLCRSAPF